MPQFKEGQRVTVRPEVTRAAFTRDPAGKPVQEHLACTPGVIVAGGRPDVGLYAVTFRLMYGTATVMLSERDLEA